MDMGKPLHLVRQHLTDYTIIDKLTNALYKE